MYVRMYVLVGPLILTSVLTNINLIRLILTN